MGCLRGLDDLPLVNYVVHHGRHYSRLQEESDLSSGLNALTDANRIRGMERTFRTCCYRRMAFRCDCWMCFAGDIRQGHDPGEDARDRELYTRVINNANMICSTVPESTELGIRLCVLEASNQASNHPGPPKAAQEKNYCARTTTRDLVKPRLLILNDRTTKPEQWIV
jgi:hypothetical protein